ncbi:MAG: carbohydrate ABC transporter permease [Blautia sp.]|jgi:raffinose/stachyose/melibiose transport system permease protein
MHKKKVKPGIIIKYIILIMVSVLMLYPLLWMGISSLKENSEIFSRPFALPSNPKWENYSLAWEAAEVPVHMLNSVFYSVTAVIFTVAFSAMAAYVIARLSKGKKLYHYFSLGIMIPINAIIIPFILIFRKIDILNTRQGIILAFIVTNLAFSIFILVPFMKELPEELEDAAMIDGCGRVQTFCRIILPISKGGLATVGTFVLLNSWNDLFLSLLIISKQDFITLNQVCYNMKAQYVSDYGLISAAVMILILPVLIFFILFQKQVVKGMTAGSIKG